jgi:hypothetical protein
MAGYPGGPMGPQGNGQQGVFRGGRLGGYTYQNRGGAGYGNGGAGGGYGGFGRGGGGSGGGFGGGRGGGGFGGGRSGY